MSETQFKIRMPDRSQISQMLASYDENDREIDDYYGYGSDITDENDREIDEFEGNEIFDNFILPEEMKLIKNLENGLDLDYDEDD